MTNKYLQHFRKDKGLSTADLATKMGISKSLYEKVEYGIRNPSYGFTSKLKSIFPEADIDKIVQEARSLEGEKLAT